MNDFVDQCRAEWKRLGVRDEVAEDMATELAADLEEASPEEVLGADARDARAFAREWAAERGVVRTYRRSRLPAVAATLAVVPTLIGAVLTIDAARPESTSLPRVQIPTPSVWVTSAPAPPALVIAQGARDRAVLAQERSRLVAADDDSNTLGIVLLIAGLALLVPATLLWSIRVALNR